MGSLCLYILIQSFNDTPQSAYYMPNIISHYTNMYYLVSVFSLVRNF